MMEQHTEILATDLIYSNLLVYRTYTDGEFTGYKVVPESGYVMYDTAANDVECDPDTMEEIPVIYYYTLLYLPKFFSFDNFTWVAVERSSVDENYIFGGGNDNKPEVM